MAQNFEKGPETKPETKPTLSPAVPAGLGSTALKGAGVKK
jgi:hypothetical protein